GFVYAENSFMQQVWGGRRDFTRWTHVGHRRLFHEFDELRSGPIDGPGTALAWAWQYFLLGFARTRWTRLALRAIARSSGFWLKYVDRFLVTRPGAYDAASGFFFLGQSRPNAVSDREIVAGYRGAFRS
ncbi:MAG: methyltransferase type 11, partial [Gaiellaceae bacterium]